MRLLVAKYRDTTISFNPRICKRCDLITNMIKLRIESFNPRICKRCDLVPPNSSVRIKPVSIHASVKDATGAS